jgi:riboflavin kinase/FMN adenylyltransferase
MTKSILRTKPFVVERDAAPGDALRGAVLAIGNFDGVHRGHRAVIGAALARARASGRPAAGSWRPPGSTARSYSPSTPRSPA